MESLDYILAWTIYLLAAAVLSWFCWKFLKKHLWREIAYLLQSFILAIFFTPWYVLAEEEILAPAIIIFVLDWLTVSRLDSIRALIPIVMAFFLGIIVTVILGIIYRLRRRGTGTAEQSTD